jgi:hypothetical protein
MSLPTILRGARRVFFALTLATVMGIESFAAPIFRDANAETPVAPQNEFFRRAESPPEVIDTKAPPPITEFDAPRAYESPQARRLSLDRAPVAGQNDYLSLPGHDADTRLNQALQKLINVNTDPASKPAASRERSRRDGAQDSGLGELEFVTAAEAMIRDAVVSAMEEGIASLPLAGLGEFSLTLGGDRHTLSFNGSELFSLALSDGGYQKTPSEPRETRSAGSATAMTLPRIIAVIRELVTDPMTISVALGLLIVWRVLEREQSDRSRRHSRRRATPVRTPIPVRSSSGRRRHRRPGASRRDAGQDQF